MDFYFATYRTESFSFGKWRKSSFGTGVFVVIADNIENAIEKINICLTKESGEKLRRVLTSNVKRCEGLRIIDNDGEGYRETQPV